MRNPEEKKIRERDRAKWRYHNDSEYKAKTDARNAAYAKAHPEIERRRSWRRVGFIELPTRPCPDTCELCDHLPGKKSLAADHNPKTGRFRGWLCHRCNLALGLFRDSSDLCIAAAKHLRVSELI